jgi:hypothetical protein
MVFFWDYGMAPFLNQHQKTLLLVFCVLLCYTQTSILICITFVMRIVPTVTDRVAAWIYRQHGHSSRSNGRWTIASKKVLTEVCNFPSAPLHICRWQMHVKPVTSHRHISTPSKYCFQHSSVPRKQTNKFLTKCATHRPGFRACKLTLFRDRRQINLAEIRYPSFSSIKFDSVHKCIPSSLCTSPTTTQRS